MAPPSLKPVQLRMERASEHATDLQVEIRKFLETDPYSVVHQFDRKSTPDEFPPGPPIVCVHRYRAQVDAQVPDRISILAGDVVKNLREALDYVAWQLATAQSASPPQSTAFPIFRVKESYDRDKGRFIGAIDPALHSIFDAVQPYQAGDKASENALWVLHRLSNDDKHKIPSVVGSVPVRVEVERGPGVDFFVATQIGPFEDGDQIAYVGIYKAPKPEQEPNLEVTFDVGFGKDTPAWRVAGLYSEIDRIGREVEAVIKRFLPFFPTE